MNICVYLCVITYHLRTCLSVRYYALFMYTFTCVQLPTAYKHAYGCDYVLLMHEFTYIIMCYFCTHLPVCDHVLLLHVFTCVLQP